MSTPNEQWNDLLTEHKEAWNAYVRALKTIIANFAAQKNPSPIPMDTEQAEAKLDELRKRMNEFLARHVP